FRANATGLGGWKLSAAVPHFTGFHHYPMTWGYGGPGFFVIAPDGHSYSNRFGFPNDAPHPPTGGAIDFAGRTFLGLGFNFTSDAADSTAVLLTGRARCHYPPPPR